MYSSATEYSKTLPKAQALPVFLMTMCQPSAVKTPSSHRDASCETLSGFRTITWLSCAFHATGGHCETLSFIADTGSGLEAGKFCTWVICEMSTPAKKTCRITANRRFRTTLEIGGV